MSVSVSLFLSPTARVQAHHDDGGGYIRIDPIDDGADAVTIFFGQRDRGRDQSLTARRQLDDLARAVQWLRLSLPLAGGPEDDPEDPDDEPGDEPLTVAGAGRASRPAGAHL